MNILGTKKDTDISGDFRQFVINCLGENDQRKYFVVSEFGSDHNAPDQMRVLTSGSRNKDDKFALGFLNGLKLDDLAKGEKAIFSTSEDGTEIKAKIVFRNTGDLEIESAKDVNLTVTGDVNLTVDGKVNVTATQLNVNSGNLTVD